MRGTGSNSSLAGGLLGLALAILGALAVQSPHVVGVAITVLVAALLLWAGTSQCVFAFKAQSGRGRLFAWIFGGLDICCGFVVITDRISHLMPLTPLLAVYFFVLGIFEIVDGLKLKPTNGWWWQGLSGAASLLVGIIICLRWRLIEAAFSSLTGGFESHF